MVFSSPIFLFLFLPVVLTIHQVLPSIRARNHWLLLTSLLFYAWGETSFLLLLLASTLANYGLGLWVSRTGPFCNRKSAVFIAIFVNLGLLAVFKYTNLVVSTLNSAFTWIGLPLLKVTPIDLPIGISFFTFHAISYILDVYRGKAAPAKDPRQVALYIFFFPQLVAGPILRWSAMAPQFLQRRTSVDQFAEGVRRFAGGLAKKILIANTLAVPADGIFGLSASELSTPAAWLGIICYTLQIYFDFSGYSDMAVGLGKMFGFTFLENFQFPYVAQSIRDFWRRWHISLSTWFRDYLYIPLGGNRGSPARTHWNLLLVFFLCGLWHGANLTFVVWGLYHGLFLILERTRFGKLQEKAPQMLRHFYTVLVVMGGWVIFRSETIVGSWHYFLSLLGLQSPFAPKPYEQYITPQVMLALLLGCGFSGPTLGFVKEKCRCAVQRIPAASQAPVRAVGLVLDFVLVIALFVVSAIWLAGATYNPFIYYRF